MSTKPYIAYISGFLLSVLLTLAAYDLATRHILVGNAAIYTILGLGFVQFAVQLFFFLHLGNEKRPFWNLSVFVSTLGVILIVIFASMWIMNNLNYRHHLTPAQQSDYILQEEGFVR